MTKNERLLKEIKDQCIVDECWIWKGGIKNGRSPYIMVDGKPMGFTGVDDPYEQPIEPEITLQGFGASAEENARIVVAYLEAQGYIGKQA